ncbi:Asp-tRNA(Asn)/Glu-tRNA(Gln) amidotransferase subunit GatC [Planctomicrobium sp. SH668]|uniref:Asp-tRNA(Asn)/Glu-tRNA(Gln) amidotransferase subunit GatC n=1 Tax=Planctomicrobium sp. SH668 TaxID=3448126 RepID=UPI003F5C73E4
MSLTSEDVLKVARLSRLKLGPQDAERYAGELGNILNYIEQLNEIDTSGVEPMAHTSDLTNVFRADEPTPSLDRAEALANAPKSNAKYFLVPQILEGA